jgi:transposase
MQTHPQLTVGIDLGDRKSVICVLDVDGQVSDRATLLSTPASFEHYFSGLPSARMAMEAGTHSPWSSRLLKKQGHEVLVADPAALHQKGRPKTDKIDAEQLARWARVDPQVLHPIQHRGEVAQIDLALIRSRDALVRARTMLVNHVRGSVKAVGARLPRCSTNSFARSVEDEIPDLLLPALAPVLEVIDRLSKQIRQMDKEIEELAEERYTETARLRQVTGVGALTALAYVLVLEDPKRVKNSRSVGPYLGLAPRADQSGETNIERRVSKRGDRLLRRLLIGSAQYILGPFGPDCDLKRWGMAHMRGGSKVAKRKAVVGVARKLAVLLHRLWTTGERYEPLRQAAATSAA